MIRGIKFASIPVGDQDRALTFYTERLGFKVVTDQPFDEKQRWIELGIPGAETRLVLFSPDGADSPGGDDTLSHVTFMTDDVQKTHEELVSRGVRFTSEPTSEHWGAFAIFEDSEGNRFVLSSR